ncbi:hypothetical protein DFJ43DRAFT_1152229 [Lentinula guzmanii]|uniref:Uncharacterized protein n=1 Tax=Lentinula guzmanii TaxID=2804957 RepID=A0AA38JSD3_9AGAR|nr:hypothetical protein DFJ43DRAFT_1152229 [Lentinula guzmanii]
MGPAIVRFNSFWALFQDFSASLRFMINDLKRQLLDFSSSGRPERMVCEPIRIHILYTNPYPRTGTVPLSFLELRNIDRCLRRLSTEIAQLEESLVNFQIVLPCALTTCTLLENAFQEIYTLLSRVSLQTRVHVIKHIACGGANSLEDQESYSLLLASLSVQTFEITEISKTLQRQSLKRFLDIVRRDRNVIFSSRTLLS